MKKFWGRHNLFIPLVIVASFFLFLPGIGTYFHQDDFIHFSYSQNPGNVISAFNIFQKGDFPFYRPIPTQLYFYMGKILFGYNPLGYHIVNFLIFSLNIFLVFRLVKFISKKETTARVAVIFFAINSTHFAPLFSAAYVHELFYVLFGVLTADNFLRKKYLLSLVFFILSLMSKETAVVLPAIILLTDLFVNNKRRIREIARDLFPYLAVLGIYLLAHFAFYGIAKGASYTFMVGKPTINILAWYFLWAMSVPNILIDFIGPGLSVNPVFFRVAKINGIVFAVFFPLFFIIGSVLSVKLAKLEMRSGNWQRVKLTLFGVCWFIAGMMPLVIFPLHKLATEQAFSLVGLSIALAVLSNSLSNIPSRLFIIIYLIVAVNSILLAGRTHWIAVSSRQAKNTVEFIKTRYPDIADDAAIYFTNGEVKIAAYGSSRQIYQALGNGIGLSLILHKPHLHLFFEDIDGVGAERIKEKNVIIIDSSKLLGY